MDPHLYWRIGKHLTNLLSHTNYLQQSTWHPETSLSDYVNYLISYLLKTYPEVYFDLRPQGDTIKLHSHVYYSSGEFNTIPINCDILSQLCRFNIPAYELLLVYFSILHHHNGIELWYDDEEWACEYMEEKLFDRKGYDIDDDQAIVMRQAIRHYRDSAFHHFYKVLATPPSLPYFKMLLRQYHPRLTVFKQLKELLSQSMHLWESPRSLTQFQDYYDEDDQETESLKEEGLLEPRRYFRFYWNHQDPVYFDVREYYESTANGIGSFEFVRRSELNTPEDLLGDFNSIWPHQILDHCIQLGHLLSNIQDHLNHNNA
ncbi:MAG: hypothetical protein RID25_23370 [Cyclobacteriaceae bacterium]